MKFFLCVFCFCVSHTLLLGQEENEDLDSIISVEEVDEARLAMNPILHGHSAILRGEKIHTVHVFTMNGQLIEQYEFENPRHMLAIRDLQPGFYIIKVNSVQTIKLSVQ